jgi:hypothetical protein
MPLVNPAELDTIDLGEGEWAKIKRRMSFGDMTRLEDEMARIRLKHIPEGRDVSADDFEAVEIKGAKLLILELNVREWNLAGADGQVAAINRETLALLDPRQAELLLAAIDERNQAPKARARRAT